MDDSTWLTERFEDYRPHLRTVAYRLLGSMTDVDDALQEAWMRLHRFDASGVENMGGWLTTIVARVCLNMLQSRRSRREEPVGAHLPGPDVHHSDGVDPEQQALLSDSVGLALLVVLDALTPAERLAFVLHDMFAVPFEEIAPIVERSPTAARQLASRARRRVRGAAVPDTDPTRQREVVAAFLAASRSGDFSALIALLDCDVVLRADQPAVDAAMSRQASGAPAVPKRVSGAGAVAGTFTERPLLLAQLALVDGVAGAVWAPGGRPRVVFGFTVRRGKIVAIDIVADPERLRRLDLAILDT